MGKLTDPYFRFFPSDYMMRTRLLDYAEKGKYIDLLCLQHQFGRLSEDDFNRIDKDHSTRLRSLFTVDEQGRYYDPELEEEQKRRREYHENQSAQGRKGAERRWRKDSDPNSDPITEPKSDPNSLIGYGNGIGNSDDIDIGISNKEIREMQEREEEKRKIVEIITYLNSKLNSRYTFTADYINKHIRARLSEGFTVEDFKTVIDKKHREWSGTEMAKFLRPETLFGTKFQQYLNQPDVPYVPKTAIGRCGVEYYVGEDATTDLDGIIGD